MRHNRTTDRAPVAARALAFALAFAIAGPMSAIAHGRGVEGAPGGGPVSTAPGPCTLTIATDDGAIDGVRDEIGPGAVVCLAAGTRPNLRIANVDGTPEAPVTIRNEGGTVLITGTDLEAGLYLQASSNLRITGSGVTSRCGALVASDEQECGIVVDGARKGLKVATARGDTEGLEIDHIAIVRVSTGEETRGIAIHPVAGQVVAGINIHHNYVTNTLAEAVYVGSEPRQQGWDEIGKVDRVEVAYNLIEDIGWDGIKVKVAVSGSRIHHNVVRNVGLANYEAHRGGVTMAMSQVIVDHNVIVNAPEGIRAGRPREGVSNRYHDNVIVDTVLGGIQTKEANARIFNNTIVGAESVGIHVRGAGTAVLRNIVADAAEPIDVRGATLAEGNVIGTTSEIGFVDPENGDFRLTDASAAARADATTTRTICPAGIRTARQFRSGVPAARSSGACRTDIGARVSTDLVFHAPDAYAPTTSVPDVTVVRVEAS